MKRHRIWGLFSAFCLLASLTGCMRVQAPESSADIPVHITTAPASGGQRSDTSTTDETTFTSLFDTSVPTSANGNTTAPTVPTTSSAIEPTQPTTPPDPPQEEMRGVWVSYLELNALLKNKTVSQAKDAIDTVMKNSVSYGMNTVVLHVRSNSNAYYDSALFRPAKEIAPLLEEGFDPLAYAVAAAHRNGLSLHAWVNPYRIGRDASYIADGITDYFSSSVTGSVIYYYTPSSPAVQKLVVDGVRELLAYGVDGIHFDDYFYPANVFSDKVPADCEKEDYAAYQERGGLLSLAGWRRAQVDTLLSAVYAVVHANENEKVVFGVSPSGQYQNCYDKQYANVQKWLATAGYVDYLCPQIYFGFENEKNGFSSLVDDWLRFSRSSSVELYIGIGLYKVGLSPDRYAGAASNLAARNEWTLHDDIMKRSVLYLRQKAKADGMLFYSYSFFDADTPRSLAVWTEGETTFRQIYDRLVGKREVENLLSLLR